MAYVIHKVDEVPKYTSYSGGTWDRAGIRSLYKEVYFRKDTARMYADILSDYSFVDFKVSEVTE